VGKSEEKRLLGRPRRRWVDNIRMNFRERDWSGMDWVDLAKDRDQGRDFVSAVINLRRLLKKYSAT
jgi:hypothetical protein